METISEIFNRDQLIQLVENDLELLADMIEMFNDHSPTVVVRLKAALSENNASEVREAAHEMKGVVGNFYAKRVAAIANDLEAQSRDGDLSHAPTLVPKLEEELGQLAVALDEFQAEFATD